MPSITEQQQQKQVEVSTELRRLRVVLKESQEQTLVSFLVSNPSCTVSNAFRFCYARKFDLARTQTLFDNYTKAVEKYGLDGVTVNDVLEELRTAKLYCPGGRDKEAGGLFVICARNHKIKQFPIEDTLKLAFYLAELVTSHPKTQRNGITLICDLDKVEWSQFDTTFLQKITSFFQNNVPCLVKHILLYKPPWWINMMLKMANPFLKEKMKQRIKICKDETALQEIIDKDELPEQLGGRMRYDHDYFIRNELSKINNVFASKATQTKKEREAEERAMFEVPKNTQYLVENKATRDSLLNEREMKLKELNVELKVQETSRPSTPVILNMLRTSEGRKQLDVVRALYYVENPQLKHKLKKDFLWEDGKRKSDDNGGGSVIYEEPQKMKRGEVSMPLEEDQLARKFTRRVSEGLQIIPTVDFEMEAQKLDKQRHASK